MHPLPQDAAESLALAALAWIAADPARAGAFLEWSGATTDDLRTGAADTGFLGFVLDFVLLDDAQVLAVADATGRSPEALLAARAALPGGDLPNWT